MQRLKPKNALYALTLAFGHRTVTAMVQRAKMNRKAGYPFRFLGRHVEKAVSQRLEERTLDQMSFGRTDGEGGNC